MAKNKVFKAAGIVMIVSLLSKIIGLLRDTMIGSHFGATYSTDAYTTSLMIPNILFGIFGFAITTTFIPILTEIHSQKNKEEMFEFSNNVMNILIVVSVIFAAIGLLTAPQIVKLVAPKFTGAKYELTVTLTRYSIVNILFLSLTSGYTAILQTLDEFMAPALVGIIMNLPIIVYLLMGNKYGIEGLTIATIIGDAMQILIQIPWLLKNNYRYHFKIDLKDSRIKKMLALIAPVIIGTCVNQINAVVQNNMASGLPDGSILALDYANKLHGMVYFTFAAAIITVVFPSLSREGTSSDYTNFKSHITTAVNSINLILFPCVVGLIILRVPIISILFQHGQFDQRAVDMTSMALFYLVFGMVFWGVRDVFNRAFYALQDTKTPMVNGILGIVVNIVLSVILVGKMGIGGLTLSTSIAALFCCILLILKLRKKIGYINGVEMVITALKVLGSSIIMGCITYLLFNTLSSVLIGKKGQIIILLICTIIAIIVYSIALYLLKVKEFTAILKELKRKFFSRRIFSEK